MLDQLINLVKENAGSAIINNNDVPNEKNDAVINTTANGIMDYLKNLAGSGGVEQITNLLKSDHISSSSEISSMSSSIASLISSKFGIDPSKSEGIVKSLIPIVMNNLSKKTNDPNDNSFTMQGIVGSLVGGSGGLGGLLDSAKKLF